MTQIKIAHLRLIFEATNPPPGAALGSKARFMSKRAGSTVVEVNGSHTIYVSQVSDHGIRFRLLFLASFGARYICADARRRLSLFGIVAAG